MSLELLRRLPLFADLPDADLRALYQTAETLSLPAGEWLMREGEPGDNVYVMLEGGVEISKRSGEQEMVLTRRGPGDFIGEMALLEERPRSASVRTMEDSRVLKINKRAFTNILHASPSAALALLRTVTERLRNTEAMLRQNEKMAALGTLAAGLAHELNNPAAAVRRSAVQLQETLTRWQRQTAELGGLTQSSAFHELQAEIAPRVASPLDLDPLTRSDREAALQTWLEARGASEAWELAPVLVAFGWGIEYLNRLSEAFPGAALASVARWIVTGCSALALLAELGTGAERISEIIAAVKAYTHLDQAPIQEVDVHEGLENTLVILKHKLKHGITIRRDYAPDLPRIEAFGGELNQLWTNLIDNAIDAMQGQGELALRTGAEGAQVIVEIGDNGSGIAPDIQSRIFEPFFTTKPPGAGTGLGLHIAHNIVRRHHGDIRVTSQPGATVFRITLPIQLQRG
ncbi:MAG: sensor histidine kinase [Anaerolineales bacterium]